MTLILDALTREGLIDLASSKKLIEAVERAGRHCSWCREPVHLRRRFSEIDSKTSEIGPRLEVEYLKACGTRLASRCPSCARQYQGDARQIVRAGLRGGKGIPDSVTVHPAVFMTLAAPSFGAVHRASEHGTVRCREGKSRRCSHGVELTCRDRHDKIDSRVGHPLCPECYAYERAVTWNALAPELWRRFTIAVRRGLARQFGISESKFASVLRLSFAKVIEYQRRGAVHIHAVIRVDAAGDEYLPGSISGVELEEIIRDAARAVSVRYPLALGGDARFGSQLRLDGLATDDDRSRRRVAGYLGKYATKSSVESGGLDRRLRSLSDLDRRSLTPHLQRLVVTAWGLGANAEFEALGLRRFAHALGFRGHWLTKSRRWSVTFALLRAQRQQWKIGDGGSDREGIEEVTSSWSFAGRGWATRGIEWYVESQRAKEDLGRLLHHEVLIGGET